MQRKQAHKWLAWTHISYVNFTTWASSHSTRLPCLLPNWLICPIGRHPNSNTRKKENWVCNLLQIAKQMLWATSNMPQRWPVQVYHILLMQWHCKRCAAGDSAVIATSTVVVSPIWALEQKKHHFGAALYQQKPLFRANLWICIRIIVLEQSWSRTNKVMKSFRRASLAITLSSTVRSYDTKKLSKTEVSLVVGTVCT